MGAIGELVGPCIKSFFGILAFRVSKVRKSHRVLLIFARLSRWKALAKSLAGSLFDLGHRSLQLIDTNTAKLILAHVTKDKPVVQKCISFSAKKPIQSCACLSGSNRQALARSACAHSLGKNCARSVARLSGKCLRQCGSLSSHVGWTHSMCETPLLT